MLTTHYDGALVHNLYRGQTRKGTSICYIAH